MAHLNGEVKQELSVVSLQLSKVLQRGSFCLHRWDGLPFTQVGVVLLLFLLNLKVYGVDSRSVLNTPPPRVPP
jgi:hypothetical protein